MTGVSWEVILWNGVGNGVNQMGEEGKESLLYQADQHSVDLGNGLRDLLRSSGTH